MGLVLDLCCVLCVFRAFLGVQLAVFLLPTARNPPQVCSILFPAQTTRNPPRARHTLGRLQLVRKVSHSVVAVFLLPTARKPPRARPAATRCALRPLRGLQCLPGELRFAQLAGLRSLRSGGVVGAGSTPRPLSFPPTTTAPHRHSHTPPQPTALLGLRPALLIPRTMFRGTEAAKRAPGAKDGLRTTPCPHGARWRAGRTK